MPISLTKELMRAIVLDHYEEPRHKRKPPKEGYRSFELSSPNCIDDITVFLLLQDEIIIDALWDGTACAISTAATDIMCDLIIGKTRKDAGALFGEYMKMIHEEPFDEESLGEAIVFKNTSRQAARIKCATIGWDALMVILKEQDGRP